MKIRLISLGGWKPLLLPAAAVVLAAVLFTTFICREPAAGPAQGKVQPVYKVKTKKKVAALTFNVSWGTRVTGAVLETLEKQDVKATFFVSGSWARRYPELAGRIVAGGHELASYGDRQISLSTGDRSVIREEIARSREQIKEVTGRAPALFRPPYGDWNGNVLEIAAEEGFTMVQWSVDSLDIQTPGVPAIANNVLNKIHPGAIVLMSAADSAFQTPEALPRVIEGLKAAGYNLVTVQDLLKTGPAVVD
ncbi:MAG: polysaccharide deacetylase family protein [Firmicutes bacterium]|nr:polysaccharide deacetylase family protein [Bacillota bacterium]